MSIPHHLLQSQAGSQQPWTQGGSILDADPPAQGVKIARRNTAKRADCRKGGDRLHLSGHDRAAPTVAFSSTTFSNASTLGSGRATFDHVRMSALVTATGYGVASTNLALGAEI